MPNHHQHHLQALLRSTPPSSSSSAHSFTSKLLLLLTILPLTLAALAFVLQWRGGGLTDPTTRWAPPGSQHLFPGMDPSPLSPTAHRHSSSSDCVNLGRGSSPSFPYYQGWKFDSVSNLRPKVRVCCEILRFFVMFMCFCILLFNIQSKIVSLIRSDILVSGVVCFWLLLFMLHPSTKSLTLRCILGYGVDLFQGFANLLFMIRILVLVQVQFEA
jgi:hypothetical protein